MPALSSSTGQRPITTKDDRRHHNELSHYLLLSATDSAVELQYCINIVPDLRNTMSVCKTAETARWFHVLPTHTFLALFRKQIYHYAQKLHREGVI